MSKDTPLVTLDNYEEVTGKKLTDYLYTYELSALAFNHKLSEGIIRYFGDRWSDSDWLLISRIQSVNNALLRDYINKLDWFCISAYQQLDEATIRRYIDLVSFKQIERYQNLSDEFKLEFRDKLELLSIIKHVISFKNIVYHSMCIKKSSPNVIYFSNQYIGTKEFAIKYIKRVVTIPDECDKHIKQIKKCFKEAKRMQKLLNKGDKT